MDHILSAAEVFNKNAALYQQKYMNVEPYHASFDLFCQHIPQENAAILEIGCGPGNVTRYLRDRRPDFRILATDIAPNMLELARVNSPGATFEPMDARDISHISQQFNGIMCGFCLPYLNQEEAAKLIADAADRLLPGGVLYLSTMEDDYEKSGVVTSSAGDKVYMYYHPAAALTTDLENSGFEVIFTDRKQYPGFDGNMTTDLLLLARKK
ncbi:class I SAM-dependent methyltransferase [Chitinophaga arvensicola]|uniref:Methyltransferase domain-containing protein n=1 Tax=Chitinophaga arvensicola TaxID=29529 RepID=A0A1I0SA18_9BACT|nr:class I SAM-dependent methyltransferase [Chitinophaga arvensicola]SEW53059.1 Methyltransferase domain-containing protein [Chitinophaga arvensicola]